MRGKPWPWLAETGRPVAFVGSGGKTRLMTASVLTCPRSRPVVAGTTTHIFPPPCPVSEGELPALSTVLELDRGDGKDGGGDGGDGGDPPWGAPSTGADGRLRRPGPPVERLLLGRDEERLLARVARVARRERRLAVASACEGGKLRGHSPAFFEALARSDVLARGQGKDRASAVPPRRDGRGEGPLVLVEADGARGCALKLWRAHEPVLPVGATTVLCLGLASWGRPLVETELFGFGEELSDWAGRVLDGETLDALLRHPRGARAMLERIREGQARQQAQQQTQQHARERQQAQEQAQEQENGEEGKLWVVATRLPGLRPGGGPARAAFDEIREILTGALPRLSGVLALPEGGWIPGRCWTVDGARE